MPLDLLVPDLLLPADAPPAMRALRLPALERWLDGADILRVEARSARDWMAAAFGLPVPAPVAPVTAVADGVVSEGAWLRVDPVHLAIVRDAVVLHPPSVLDVTPSEADALVAALQAHFREDGLEFVAPRADRWYLRVPAGELPATTALEDAIGRNVFGLLPRSAGRIDWRATLNEAQMLLGTHDVNARRERENRPPINSIWPWGGGVLPAPVTSSYEVVAADDLFACGLAMLAKARLAAAALDPEGVEARAGQSVLVVADGLSAPLSRRDPEAWCAAALALEAGWFAQLDAARRRFHAVRVILPGADDTVIAALRKLSALRFLRRARAIETYA